MIRRTKRTRTLLNHLGDVALVVFAVGSTYLATEAMDEYAERKVAAEQLQRVHTDGMAIGATMCTQEPQP